MVMIIREQECLLMGQEQGSISKLEPRKWSSLHQPKVLISLPMLWASMSKTMVTTSLTSLGPFKVKPLISLKQELLWVFMLHFWSLLAAMHLAPPIVWHPLLKSWMKNLVHFLFSALLHVSKWFLSAHTWTKLQVSSREQWQPHTLTPETK